MLERHFVIRSQRKNCFGHSALILMHMYINSFVLIIKKHIFPKQKRKLLDGIYVRFLLIEKVSFKMPARVEMRFVTLTCVYFALLKTLYSTIYLQSNL